MSYVVTIRRATPITSGELRDAAAQDGEFTLPPVDPEVGDGVCELVWQPEGARAKTRFVLTDGVIDVASPSNEALSKMQGLARRLGAEVYGEENEVLTDVEVPEGEPGGCGPLVAIAVAVGGLGLLLYWLLG